MMSGSLRHLRNEKSEDAEHIAFVTRTCSRASCVLRARATRSRERSTHCQWSCRSTRRRDDRGNPPHSPRSKLEEHLKAEQSEMNSALTNVHQGRRRRRRGRERVTCVLMHFRDYKERMISARLSLVRLLLPDFMCASRARHSAAPDFASSTDDLRRMSIRIPQPTAVFTDGRRSGIKPASTTI